MNTFDDDPKVTCQAIAGWYMSHCDGDWEHQGGIKIETLDNPGWLIEIILAGIECSRDFEHYSYHKSDTDWARFSFETKTDVLQIICSPNNLGRVLKQSILKPACNT